MLLCLSFVVGVFVGKYLNYYVMAVAAMIFVMTASLAYYFKFSTSSNNKTLLLFGCLGLTLLLGAWRLRASFPHEQENYIGKFYGQEVDLQGVVVREPDVRSKKVNLTVGRAQIRPLSSSPLASSRRNVGARGEDLEGNVLLNVGRYPEYQYGDRLKISGKLEEPFESEDFSYKNYLSRFDTYALMRFPRVEKLAEAQGHPVKAALLRLKIKFQNALTQILPEPHASLVLGIILGLKRALPEALQEALQTTGVSHIIVVSGYNISIIIRGLLRTRSLWGRQLALIFSLLAIFVLVIITGAEASVIRAGLMGSLLVLALGVGRIYQADRILLVAASLMILQSPKILRFDIGFQLSFLATLGLIYLSPVLEKWFRKLPDFLSFRTNLASTGAAIIFTLPVLIYYFDRISIAAPVVNVLILWTVPYIMALGALAGLLGIVFLPLAQIITWFLWAFLEYVIWLVEFFARLPLASVAAEIPIGLVIIYYGFIIYLLWRWRKLPHLFLPLF